MFKDKVVIVTGGAQGIGAAVVEGYMEQGAQVVVADIQPAKAGYYIETNVADPKQIEHLMTETVAKFGKIDILINNAGKFVVQHPIDLDVALWDELIHTNLRSVFLCAREAAKYMDGGSIVSMASTRAFQSEAYTEAYAASKGGIVALTHALAVSLSEKNITVNCISPGWIETEHYEELRDIDHAQHLSNRVGKPADIVATCFYLTNPQNRFVTGQNITVDGGMTKKMLYEE